MSIYRAMLFRIVPKVRERAPPSLLHAACVHHATQNQVWECENGARSTRQRAYCCLIEDYTRRTVDLVENFCYAGRCVAPPHPNRSRQAPQHY
jgi:hypothetical protein